MTQEVTGMTVKNFKGVREISLQPSGSLVVLAGGNGEGKSSFIDAFVEMFDPKGVRLTPKPIREGATEATAELITSEARIVRTWKKNDAGKLEAFALNGTKWPSGKDFLLKATGGALFDPYEFVKLDEKAQREQLLARVELPFDLDEITAQRKALFDARTDVNRDVKRLDAQLAMCAPANPSLPDEEESVAALMAGAEKARQHNADIQRAIDLSGQLDVDIQGIEQRIAELTEKRETLRRKLLDITPIAARELIDMEPITTQLQNIDETNAAIRAQKQRQAIADELADRTAERDRLSAKLDAIDEAKSTGLASAKFPVEGLSVDDDGITFGGIPFKQVNTAQKTAIAFNLATLAQPDLRLIVIKDGDSLDKQSLAGIERIATERGYIVLVERDRDESREIGFVIKDGQVES